MFHFLTSIVIYLLNSSIFWIIVIIHQFLFTALFLKMWSATAVFRKQPPSSAADSPFRRLDSDKWRFLPLFFGGFCFFWIRFYFGFTLIFIASTITTILGTVFNVHAKNSISLAVANFINSYPPLLLCYLFGTVPVFRYIEFDYTPWLGENYEKTGEATLHISNHVCWSDILVYMGLLPPGFIAKKGVQGIPGVGVIATNLGCIFLDRNDSKDKKLVFDKLSEKLNDIKNGKVGTKFLIFPEGTTSNGSHILQFKKGAFFGNYSIRPLVHIVPNEAVSPAFDVIPMKEHFFFTLCTMPKVTEVLVLPVFHPNEKLYEGKEGERWLVYAEAMREVMSKASGLKLSDKAQEDKFKYIEEVYPTKKKED